MPPKDRGRNRPLAAVVVPQATVDEIVALLRDPALAAAPSDTGGGGVQIALRTSIDDHSLDLRFREPAPAAARALVSRLEDLVTHPPPLPAFSLTVTTQRAGGAAPVRIISATSAGTLAIDEDGRRTREAELSPIDVAVLAAALADPELRRAPSSDLQGAGTLVTLRATGDVSLDLHFPDGEGPAVTLRFLATVERIANPPQPPTHAAALGAACGGLVGIPCDRALTCDYRDACRVSDAMGTCVQMPAACRDDDAPVCACGHRTYRNDCERLRGHASKEHDGPCAP